MNADSKYDVTVGLSVSKAEAANFADFGLHYSQMPYDFMVQVEAAFARHADEINQAMGPLIAELVGMGIEQSAAMGLGPENRGKSNR